MLPLWVYFCAFCFIWVRMRLSCFSLLLWCLMSGQDLSENCEEEKQNTHFSSHEASHTLEQNIFKVLHHRVVLYNLMCLFRSAILDITLSEGFTCTHMMGKASENPICTYSWVSELILGITRGKTSSSSSGSPPPQFFHQTSSETCQVLGLFFLGKISQPYKPHAFHISHVIMWALCNHMFKDVNGHFNMLYTETPRDVMWIICVKENHVTCPTSEKLTPENKKSVLKKNVEIMFSSSRRLSLLLDFFYFLLE